VWGILGKVAQAGKEGRDVAAASLLDQSHPWYPMARHWLGLMYSAEPEDISTRDAGNYNDTGINLAVEDGYGALIARLAAGLPVRTGTAARKVTGRAQDVVVETGEGTITAKAVIVATPARMLETGRVEIAGMPAEIAAAFAQVPMGYYEKIAIAFDANVFEGFEMPYADIFDPVAPTTHPLNFELHPFGRPLAITHIAGHFARDMERQGEAGMIDFAVAALVRAFGSDLRKRVKKAVTTHWSSDVFINGAYSCARPGHGDARKAFATPIRERIFLAGEHVHPSFQATAHGAFETGEWAAAKAVALLGRRIKDERAAASA
jgi:monoamine oxidase